MVMMVIIVLSAIVGALAMSMSVEMRLARNTNYDNQLEWMGRSGMELARYALGAKKAGVQSVDSLNQYWSTGIPNPTNGDAPIMLADVPLGAGHISVKIVDMERKWDINLVAAAQNPQMDILQKAMNVVGVTDAGQSSTIIDSILDWINPSGESRFSGAKNDYYLHLKQPYYCKNGNVDDLSELLLVKGMTQEIYWGSFSSNHPMSSYQQHGGGAFNQEVNGRGFGGNNDEPVYPHGLEELFSPKGGRLNINTASALTLQLIPGIDASTAAQIIQQRSGPDGVDGTDDDVPFQNPGELNSGFGAGGNVPGAPAPGVAAGQIARYCDVRSYVFEVHVEAKLDNHSHTYYGIISRSGPNPAQMQCVRFYWE